MEASQVFMAGWMDKEYVIYTYSRWLYSAFFNVDHFFEVFIEFVTILLLFDVFLAFFGS